MKLQSNLFGTQPLTHSVKLVPRLPGHARVRLSLVLACMTLGLSSLSAQNIIYVDAANASGTEDGTSWATAFTDLQEAMVASLNAVGPDEVWVASGTYKPTSCSANCEEDTVRAKTFQLLNEVTLLGGFDGTETDKADRNPMVNLTILSGDLLGNDNPNDLRKEAPSRAENSNHVVTGDLTDNSAVLDGFVIRGGNARSDVLNTQSGGGMINNAGSPTVRNCVFENNVATAAGAMDCSNGGSPIVVNTIFRNNVASDLGGAISVFQEAEPMFINCLFHDNAAGQTGGASYSGDNGQGDTTIATFYNCTFYGNSSVDVGPTHAGQLNSTAIFMNCILWKNNRNGAFSPQIKLSDSAKVEVSYSIIEMEDTATVPFEGVGNLLEDPSFFDELSRDFRINSTSPAVDAGGSVPMDLGDLDEDSVFTEDLPFDLAGDDRVQMVEDGGIDMGAYENDGVLNELFAMPQANGLRMTLAPNPTTASAIYLALEGIRGQVVTVSLLNLNGQVVHRERWSVTGEETLRQLEAPALSAGLYLIQASTSGQRLSQKLMLQ